MTGDLQTPVTGSGLATLPPALRSYLLAHQLDARAFVAEGCLGLTFDGRWRVQVRVLADRRLMLSALLMDVSQIRDEALEDLLMALGSYAVGLMRTYAGGLALDTAARRLLLQQAISAEASLEELETHLGDFITQLSFWAGVLPLETTRRQIIEVH